jgi:hypothetical protein
MTSPPNRRAAACTRARSRASSTLQRPRGDPNGYRHVAPDFHEIHLDPAVIEQTKRAADEISHPWPLVHLEV